MKKVYAVPMIAFVTVGPGETADDHIEKVQALVAAHGLAQILQDELIDSEEVADANDIRSVMDLNGNALASSTKELIAASAAPWRTLSNEPDAMKFINRLEAAAKEVNRLFN